MKSPAMRKLRCLLCYWCGRLPRSVKKSPIEDISLRARQTLEGDRQQLTGLGLCSCPFCLAMAIIIKDLQESLILQLLAQFWEWPTWWQVEIFGPACW